MKSTPRDIVMTGLGVVSPIGIGYEAVARSLTEGKSGVRRLPAYDATEFPVRVGAEVVGFDAKAYVTPRKSLKVMSRNIQLAFAAAQMARVQAGIDNGQLDPERLGVDFGADMIQIEPDELVNAFRSCISGERFDFTRWTNGATDEMFPLWLLKYLPNMPACHMAIAQDARGPNNTIVLAEASSLLAIGEGMRVIQRGQADVMIVGGTGSRLHPLSWAFRDNVLHSPRWESPETISRPFDSHRDGMIYGEGAAAFVIESRAHAQARGARMLARVCGFGSGFEPCKPGEPFAGTAIRAAIAQSLREAELTPGEIGHINAHGASTLHHDRVEAQAIAETFGSVPVTALKSYFGNLGGGTGAVELIGSLLALDKGAIPPTLNYEVPDPTCPVNVVRGEPLAGRAPIALALNQTSMGQSVALILSAPDA